jgi:hypothetical protein
MSAPRLLRWLILLALLLAPLAMIGGAPAMAHARPAAAVHCAETEKPAKTPPSAPVDCMIACVGCLPAQGGTLAAQPRPGRATEPEPLAFRLQGLHPEAATPPPRSS